MASPLTVRPLTSIVVASEALHSLHGQPGALSSQAMCLSRVSGGPCAQSRLPVLSLWPTTSRPGKSTAGEHSSAKYLGASRVWATAAPLLWARLCVVAWSLPVHKSTLIKVHSQLAPGPCSAQRANLSWCMVRHSVKAGHRSRETEGCTVTYECWVLKHLHSVISSLH